MEKIVESVHLPNLTIYETEIVELLYIEQEGARGLDTVIIYKNEIPALISALQQFLPNENLTDKK